MRHRIDSRIGDEPTRGWVDEELGLILNPSRDCRTTGPGRTRSRSPGRVTVEGTPSPADAEASKQPT